MLYFSVLYSEFIGLSVIKLDITSEIVNRKVNNEYVKTVSTY